ncbi:MAG: type II toxin-antitoxin system HicB family antitoxin [Nitrococcus sp.]|nr:type II toxin-antitoxin system HicB family antitoxin [Nitrococcus sp.]
MLKHQERIEAFDHDNNSAVLEIYCPSKAELAFHAIIDGCPMKIKAVIHDAEEGGYWAEFPSIPGCVTQGDTFEELLSKLYEAVEGCLSVEVNPASVEDNTRVLEIAV